MLTELEALLFNIILYQSKKGLNNFTSAELSRMHPKLNQNYIQYLLSRLEKKKYLTWVSHKSSGRTFNCLVTDYNREYSGIIPPFSMTKTAAESSISVAKSGRLEGTLRIAAAGEQTHLIEQAEECWKNIRLDQLSNEELTFLVDVLGSMISSPQDILKEKLERLDISSLSDQQINQLLAFI